MAQVQPGLQEVQDAGQSQGNPCILDATRGADANFPGQDILKTLNNIASRFDRFKQQAKIDREKVSRL